MGTAQTEVWFKTQDVVNGADSTYYLYYGNPTAGSPPAHWSDSMGAAATASKVYLAADDFEDEAAGSQPDGWEGSSKYTVEQVGSNKVLRVAGTNPDADYLFAGDYSWTDVAVQARLRVLLTSGDHYGLFTRAESPSNFDTLFFGLESNNRLTLYTCNLSSASATGLSASFEGQWTLSPPAGTSWHVIEVRTTGQKATLHWDGVQKGIYNIAANQMQQGRIGLCSGYPASQAYWDDVVVRRYVDPEPSVTPSAEESGCP
jgi:hypothetical protein